MGYPMVNIAQAAPATLEYCRAMETQASPGRLGVGELAKHNPIHKTVRCHRYAL